MPLDGLRAWIGEVERKLGMRTRVFLVLATIAIGGAGAAIYLTLDTRDDAVSESDVRQLQEELEGRVGTGEATGDADLTQLQAELDTLEAEVERLSGKEGGLQGSKGGAGEEAPGGGAADGSGDAADSPDEASDGGVSPDNADEARLRDLIEEAKKQNAKAQAAE